MVCFQYTPEIYIPIDDNSVSAEGRARSFDTLNPRSHYSDICGRKFVETGRTGRIVGGGVANYAEWPWQVLAAVTATDMCVLQAIRLGQQPLFTEYAKRDQCRADHLWPECKLYQKMHLFRCH